MVFMYSESRRIYTKEKKIKCSKVIHNIYQQTFGYANKLTQKIAIILHKLHALNSDSTSKQTAMSRKANLKVYFSQK